MKKRILVTALCAVMLLSVLCSCGVQGEEDYYQEFTGEVELAILEEEAVAMAELPPAVSAALEAKQGELVKETQKAAIDYSHTEDGYVMVNVKANSGKRWKAQVKGPSTTYTYNLTPEQWTVFSLSDGNGSYKITVYENVSGTKYASVVSQTCSVTLKDEFGPFLYSNQFVDFAAAPKAVAKAAELTAAPVGEGAAPLTELEQVAKIYDFVVAELTYDRELAASVTSGYLPVLDNVLEKKKGICFDYAALMTGMLRSQGIPCKLVVGYAGTAYHAWINVWTEEQGWIDNVIYFNGTSWQRMDPTFASGGGKSQSIMKYIGDGSNYTAKYFY